MEHSQEFKNEMYKYFAMEYFKQCGYADIEYLAEEIECFDLQNSDIFDEIVDRKNEYEITNIDIDFAIEIVWETAIAKALEELEFGDFDWRNYLGISNGINFYPNCIASNFYIGQEPVYDDEQLKEELEKFVHAKKLEEYIEEYIDLLPDELIDKHLYRDIPLKVLSNLPTLEQGHTDDLKYQNKMFKVWLSRMTVEDGMKYNNGVTVEYLNNIDYSWKVLYEYEAV